MSGAVDVLRVIRSAAFELRTVTTGNEGRVASQLDQVTAALYELIEAAKLVDRHYPCTANEHVVRMRAALARVQGGAE